MKKQYLTAILLFLIILQFTVNAQVSEPVYISLKDIPYYEGNVTDPYILERCNLDLIVPKEAESFTTVIWFHGGGLTGGDKFIPERLKNKGIAVAAVNYRLYPGAKCPAYIEDAAAACAWVFENIEKYGGDKKQIILAGHSAGGYLALMVGLDKQWLAIHGVDADEIKMLVPFSGHTITHMTIRKERGIPDTQPIVDLMAPLYHVRNNAPPLHLITGDRNLEMLGRYEENAYLWRMMKISEHNQTYLYELQGFDHGSMADPAFDLLINIIHNQ
jgi:acetyl esterase/lipase